MKSIKTALTIAGSDSSGGAGIQADIKTMAMHGVYAMSAITALTAQNTTGVYGIMETEPSFLQKQIDCVFEDIRPDAVKKGMVASAALIEVIAQRLDAHSARNIVVDPVMVSTSGSRLLAEDAIHALKKKLMPLACVITPNVPEAQVLAGMKIHTKEDMEHAAQRIERECGCAVLLKGGHQVCDADDLLCLSGCLRWYRGNRIDNPITHGTGCTLSSAIASNLALGHLLEEAIGRAKVYISGAIAARMNLGQGSGPLDHMFMIR